MNQKIIDIGVYIIGFTCLFLILKDVFFVREIREIPHEQLVKIQEEMASLEEEKQRNLFRGNFFGDEHLHPIVYDRINIKPDSVPTLLRKKKWTSKKSPEELKNYFMEKASRKNVSLCLWEEQMVFESLYSFNKLNSIELSVMNSILPLDERLDQFVEKPSEIFCEIRKEFVNVYSKMEKIYGYNEMENYIQLLILGYGEIYPTLQMVTVSKDKFEFIDSEVLYSFKTMDSKKVVRIKGCLNDNLDEIRVKKITETYPKAILHYDTIEYQLNLDEVGQICRIEN